MAAVDAGSAYSLPVSVAVGGRELPIRTDYRAVLDVLAAMNDPALDDRARAYVTLRIIFPGEVPPKLTGEAIAAACRFIDGGAPACSGTARGAGIRLFDWEADASLIIPAVNRVAHTEIRALPYLHWWTFLSYFFEIGESLFSSVLRVRYKRAHGLRLDPVESEFYRRNRAVCDMHRAERDAGRGACEEAAIIEWLSGQRRRGGESDKFI